jgi:hypothetical protein
MATFLMHVWAEIPSLSELVETILLILAIKAVVLLVAWASLHLDGTVSAVRLEGELEMEAALREYREPDYSNLEARAAERLRRERRKAS